MKRIFYLFTAILLSECVANPPVWDFSERQAVLKRSQIQMNMNSDESVKRAKDQMFLALEYKLSSLSSRNERLELLKEQAQWQQWFDQDNDELLCDGRAWQFYQDERAQKRYFQRFTMLTKSDEVYQIYKRLDCTSIKFNQEQCQISFGEILLITDSDEDCEYCQELSKIKNNVLLSYVVECKLAHHKYPARINLQFICSVGEYIIAIIEPTNYGIIGSYGEKQQVNLSVWKNGVNTANYLIGNEITVNSMTRDGYFVTVDLIDANGLKSYQKFDCRKSNEKSATIICE
ncbi:MAG: hypothetical protein LBM70_03935 [Victivallales bacterium]|jgi:hypothetical protein|nr:hypothetical protein [Victivallales bacterium]